MEFLAHAFAFLAVIGLGLMTGALLAEAAVLVPFWSSSPPEDFLLWYRKHAALLQNFFGPLEVAATGAAILATVLAWMTGRSATTPLAVASVCSLAVLAVFPLYFQRANTSFRTGDLALHAVAAELLVWSRWHRARTALSLAAFGAGICAL